VKPFTLPPSMRDELQSVKRAGWRSVCQAARAEAYPTSRWPDWPGFSTTGRVGQTSRFLGGSSVAGAGVFPSDGLEITSIAACADPPMIHATLIHPDMVGLVKGLFSGLIFGFYMGLDTEERHPGSEYGRRWISLIFVDWLPT